MDTTLRQGLWWVGDGLVIPDFSDLRATVIQEMHDPPYKGHPVHDDWDTLLDESDVSWQSMPLGKSQLRRLPSC